MLSPSPNAQDAPVNEPKEQPLQVSHDELLDSIHPVVARVTFIEEQHPPLSVLMEIGIAFGAFLVASAEWRLIKFTP